MLNLERMVEQTMQKMQNLFEHDKKNRFIDQQKCFQEQFAPIKRDLNIISASIARLEMVAATTANRDETLPKEIPTLTETSGRDVPTPSLSPPQLIITDVEVEQQQQETKTKVSTASTQLDPKPREVALGLSLVTRDCPNRNNLREEPQKTLETNKRGMLEQLSVSHKQVTTGVCGANCNGKENDLEEESFQKVDRKKKRTKHLVGTGRLTSQLGSFLTQRSSMYVSIYGDITDQQILNEIRRLTGDGSYTVEKLTRKGAFSAFKVTGNYLQVNRLKSPDLWPAGARLRTFYENNVKKGATTGR
jgi:hypothetical protein